MLRRTPLRRKKRWERRSGLKRRTALFARRGQPRRARKRLPRESPRRRRERIVYSVLAADCLRRNPTCEFAGCRRRSRDVHHKRGRGRFYLDPSTFMAICRTHHDWIHANGREAERLGYLERVRS